MRVCFLAPEFYPISGGGGAYAIDLLRYLPKKVEAYVLAMRRELPENKEGFSEKMVQDFFGDNVHINFISSGTDTFFSQPKFWLQCYRWVLKLHDRFSFDIIHSLMTFPDILLQFSSKKFRYVTTVHETFSRRNKAIKESKTGFSGLQSSEKWMITLSPFLEAIERLYIKKSQNVISPSNWMKNVLSEDFNFPLTNIYVVNNGVDHNRFCPEAAKSEFVRKIYAEAGGPVVLFSGRMISTKGVEVLIEAIPKIIREVKDACFIFVGGGNSMFYRQRLEKLQIPRKNYNFLGYVPNPDDIPGLYALASVFAAPTLYENFPIRILENMSCQKPVVATNVVGIPEIIEDRVNGLLIDPWDVDALSENVMTLLNDQGLARKIGQNARKTVEEKFTLQRFVNKTVEVYEKIANGNRVLE
jgi:glycosyltransferase involved in cell wall biosynthesis